jgi:alpha-L-rhamnosidase
MTKAALPLFLGMILTANLSASLTPANLSCEGWQDPLGVDLAQPKLGWTVESTERGARQTAYQIQVVTPEGHSLWDSGKVNSSETVGLPYAGQPPASSQSVLWKVRVWDETGHVSAWSPPAKWTMGVLAPEDWGRAKWIGAPDDAPPTVNGPKAQYETVLLRREFKVRPNLRRAVVHVCGLGQYEMRLNGAKVGEDFLTPGWTKYDRTSLYDTYDVTASLKTGGANALGLFLGNGMYASHKGRYIKEKGWVFGPLQAIALLRLEYQDGRVEIVVTDTDWRAFSGPITFSSPYGGEDYDARLKPAGWDQPGFDDAKWAAVHLTPGPGGKLAGLRFSAPPIREIEIFKPVSQKEFGPAVTVYDFGQNASVIPRISMHGPAGSSIKIVPSELVKKDGGIDDPTCGGRSTWTYTLAGSGPEKWTPNFFYRGARYMQVERRPAMEGGPLPELDSIETVVIHSSARSVGEFSCSNDLFNRIYTLVRWAQRSNMMSVLTDCPQREKLGWIEQNHLNGPSLRYAFDLNTLFAKGVNDMADSQLPSGLVPNIAPEYVAFGGKTRNAFGDSPEWSSSFLVVPWQQYEFTGDTALLALRYDEMKKYAAYLATRAQGDILDYGLGDWFDIGPKPPGMAQLTPKALTATAYYFYDHWIIAQAAKILGHAADAESYAKRAEEIRAAFNRRFFDPQTNQYATGSQCANAMPLVLGITEPGHREAVLQNIVADVQAKGLTAGDVGYRYLLRALADGGRSDVIFTLNNQSEKPGYGYQLKMGATSLTEAWDAARGPSQNHFMLGQINEWFFHDLAGIAPDSEAPGFKNVIVHPNPVGDIRWVKASYDSVRGEITVAWEKTANVFSLHVTIPANTTGTVFVPTRDAESVTEGGVKAANAKGVTFLRMEGSSAVLQIASGSYSFNASK